MRKRGGRQGRKMRAERGWGLRWKLGVAAGMIALFPGLLRAAENQPVKMSMTLNAGETYVIDNVKAGETPGVKVVSNPGALVIHNEEPGKITLLGAESGEWKVTVKMSDGSKAIYDITVKSVANPYAVSSPTTYSGVVNGTKPGGIVAPPVAKLDKGTGPMASASSSVGGARMVTIPESSEGASAPVQPASLPAPPVGGPASTPRAVAVPPALASTRPSASSVLPMAPPPPAPQPVVPSSGASAIAPPPATIAAGPPLKYMANPAIAVTGGTYASPAVNGGKHYLPDDVIVIQSGNSRIIDFADRIRRVSIADTNVADLQVINPYQINLIAHKPGFTTLAIWNKQGNYEERSVRIDPDSKQQVLLNTMVAELNRGAIENQGMNLSVALTHLGLSFASFPGYVATPFSPETPAFPTSPISGTLPAPGQLIAPELSQTPTYYLAAGNGDVQINGFFQYLEEHDLAKVLAQPHLLANSGEEAKFLDGGEIPIVIAQALNTSIVFKQYGTSVEFVPTVVGRSDIELLVKPEFSEPDYTHGVVEFGFTIPAFITRRAETMVRMRDNQTLIIAGLLLHSKVTQIDKVPYIGDVPYIGGLFRTTSYNNTESELVISVTPQIVKPLPDASQVYNPSNVPEMTREQIETKRLPQPDVTRPRF